MSIPVSRLRGPLLALSISLNLAFAVAWLIQALPDWVQDGPHEQQSRTAAMPPLHQQLGVTSEQWEQIEPQLLRFRRAAHNQQNEIIALRQHLLDLLAMTPVDQKAVDAKLEEILTGQRRMQILVVDHLLKEKEILSPEQASRLIQTLCEQCRFGTGALPAHDSREHDSRNAAGHGPKMEQTRLVPAPQ